MKFPPQPETGYPTIYKPLSSAKWEARNNAFQQINIYDGLGLNDYGYLKGEISMSEMDTLTEEYIISTVKSLFDNYFDFLGLKEKFNINYKKQLLIKAPYMIPNGNDNIDSFFSLWKE